MKELLGLVVLAFCLSLFNFVQAQEHCPYPSSFVCDSSQIVQYRLQVDLHRQELKSRYDMVSLLNHSEVEPALAQYLQELNDLRACQASLGQIQSPCNMTLSIKNPIGGRYFLRETAYEVSELIGTCQRRELTRDQDIINDQGRAIATSMNGFWSFQNVRPTCHSAGVMSATTSRSFSFRGYEPRYPDSKGYFQVIDWAEAESADDADEYRVSQNWARQIQMGAQTTLSFHGEGDLLKFEFSNGAYLAVDGDRGAITDSNFLSPDHFDSAQCKTNETAAGSGTPHRRARFSPALRLTPPYNNLRINTLKS